MEEYILEECEELLVDDLTEEMEFDALEGGEEEIVLDEVFQGELEELKAYEKTVLQETLQSEEETEEVDLPLFEEDAISVDGNMEEVIAMMKKYSGLKVTFSF